MIIYVAVPYTDTDPVVMDWRFDQVNRYVAERTNEGEVIFSPISMMHPVAKAHGLPRDWAFWGRFDREFLGACGLLRVLCLPGWHASTGIENERKLAEELGIPVEYEQQWVLDNVEVRQGDSDGKRQG